MTKEGEGEWGGEGRVKGGKNEGRHNFQNSPPEAEAEEGDENMPAPAPACTTSADADTTPGNKTARRISARMRDALRVLVTHESISSGVSERNNRVSPLGNRI